MILCTFYRENMTREGELLKPLKRVFDEETMYLYMTDMKKWWDDYIREWQ